MQAESLGLRLRQAELDGRLLAMTAALVGIALVLDRASDGVFLSARNLYILALQTSVVGVMATGMVLVIVARHIDLSVGSVLGFTGMAVATLQAEVLPPGAGWGWPLSVAAGLALGAAIGLWQGYWVAYRGVPAFVVTLAGLLRGSIGATWSWILGGLAIATTLALQWRGRRERRRHGFAARPLWADLGRVALASLLVVGFVGVMNAYTLPRSEVARGVPVPVLILIAVGIAMTLLTRATRFGRYVFAIGGNPEAALLAGIDVRRVTLGVFAAMGLLAAVAGVITSARLGAGTNSMGTLAELSVIAAAVIGGTSLAGGVGSVGGAILGALLMQSLENGMVLLGVSSALRQVLIGVVLILAVWVDSSYRRRRAVA
jgi:D-xylose transport system permease protein